MRRPAPISLRLRGVLLLLALLSQVGFGSAESLRCDMHGLGALAGDRVADAATAGAKAHHQPAAHHGDRGKGADGCHCTCMGDCAGTVALPSAPHAPTLRVALVIAAPRRAPDTAPARPTRSEPDRLLPFANGPPATALL